MKKTKLQVKKEIEKEIDEYFGNKVKISELSSDGKGLTYKKHRWDYWNSCHEIAEARLSQLKEDVKEELVFLKKLKKILNNYHSQIALVEVGRQNVLNDIDNELELDNRITKLKRRRRIKS